MDHSLALVGGSVGGVGGAGERSNAALASQHTTYLSATALPQQQQQPQPGELVAYTLEHVPLVHVHEHPAAHATCHPVSLAPELTIVTSGAPTTTSAPINLTTALDDIGQQQQLVAAPAYALAAGPQPAPQPPPQTGNQRLNYTTIEQPTVTQRLNIATRQVSHSHATAQLSLVQPHERLMQAQAQPPPPHQTIAHLKPASAQQPTRPQQQQPNIAPVLSQRQNHRTNLSSASVSSTQPPGQPLIVLTQSVG